MANNKLSNQKKVGVIAAFMMENGRCSYKGCELSKKYFYEAFSEATQQPLSSEEILEQLLSIPVENLWDWKLMDIDTASIVTDAVLHSDAASAYIENPTNSDIGFEILVNPFGKQPLSITCYDGGEWNIIKNKIINLCKGKFTEKALTNTYE
jgi:hypothetical protein